MTGNSPERKTENSSCRGVKGLHGKGNGKSALKGRGGVKGVVCTSKWKLCFTA